MVKDVKKHFIRIFALSLAVTLLVSPARPFSCPEEDSFITEVRAEEEPITDTQRGIALLMTIMLAQGLRFVGDWNTVVQPGLQKLWEDFSTATGNAVTLPMIVAGSSLALGYIRTSNTVNNAIANFTAWYKQTFEQPVTGDVSIPVGGDSTYGVIPANTCFLVCGRIGTYGYNTMVNSSVELRTIGIVRSGTVYWYGISQSFGYYGKSSGNFSPTSCSIGVGSSGLESRHYGGSYSNPVFYMVYSGLGAVADYYNGNYPLVYDDTNNDMSDLAYDYTFGADASIGDISMEGQSLELKDGYQLESDQAKLYDIAGLEALVASLALTLENIDDLVRDIPLIFDTPWAEDFPDVPAYVDTPDDTIPWVDVPDSVIPADTPEYVPTIPSERDEYKVLGLDQVFPFSIPFDLYYLTQILVHEPETPSFTFAMVNPVNGQLITEEVDLSDFDGLASIARTIETILFIAFLIFVTRGLIRS